MKINLSAVPIIIIVFFIATIELVDVFAQNNKLVPTIKYVTYKISEQVYIIVDTLDIMSFKEKRFGNYIESYSLPLTITDIKSLDSNRVVWNNYICIQNTHILQYLFYKILETL